MWLELHELGLLYALWLGCMSPICSSMLYVMYVKFWLDDWMIMQPKLLQTQVGAKAPKGYICVVGPTWMVGALQINCLTYHI